MYSARQRAARALEQMARFSLLPVVMTCASGCFDPVPEYSEPTRVPPVIAADKCDPPTTLLYQPVGDAEFKIAFRADDIGLNLQARLFLDLTLGKRDQVDGVSIPSDPRAFADQSIRTVTLRWTDTSSAYRCHTATAVIADGDNFEGIYVTKNPLEEARITWFVYIDDPMNPQPEPVTCLSSRSSGVPQ